MSEHQLANKVRFVTATSLFDGHDASINIFRRILQASGAEVVHLGHNRSGADIVDAAIQEDAHAIAVTSYQGGHMEFYRYLADLLVERGADHVRIFGGGGGTILPEEGKELASYGVTRIYSPDDGRDLGLTGMVADMLSRSDYPRGELDPDLDLDSLGTDNPGFVASLISAAENYTDKYADIWEQIEARAMKSDTPVVGVTGTGGSGKSSLVDEIVRRMLADFEDRTIAIISVDPSKRRSGGALLGDRIRMNSLPHPRAYMRSLATRQANLALSPYIQHAINIVKAAGFDLVILETSGIGQSDTEIVDFSDHALYVMTPEYGAATQLEKIDMLDFADLVAINKADKLGAEDALRDVRKQYKRNRAAFDLEDDNLPVYLTVASDFNDPGTNRFYKVLAERLSLDSTIDLPLEDTAKRHVVPPERSRYLAEIIEEIGRYDGWAEEQADAAERLYRLEGAATEGVDLTEQVAEAREVLDPENLRALERWDGLVAEYSGDEFVYHVRGKEVRVPLHTETLSHTRVPMVALPRYRSWGDRLRWLLQENVPGEFPYTAGVYPFRRATEDPARMFAGEGPPEQTNRRFHYLSEGMPAKRLSTAFDSVTLYGDDPHERPDIYGKVGNSGVSIATLDDAKKLYSGFDLDDPATSVSMTINGPAPMILAFFLNAAIDQACETYITENDLWEEIEAKIDRNFGDRPRPVYHGELPHGHDGLGLRCSG
jgi:isobutyryl-CoA mutase